MTRWPFAGDLPADRARQVCGEYRRALLVADPDECARIDKMAVIAGERWAVEPPVVHSDHDLVDVSTAADLVGRSVRAIYQWLASGALPRYTEGGRTVVLVSELRTVAAAQRQKRAGGRN